MGGQILNVSDGLVRHVFKHSKMCTGKGFNKLVCKTNTVSIKILNGHRQNQHFIKTFPYEDEIIALLIVFTIKKFTYIFLFPRHEEVKSKFLEAHHFKHSD